MHEIHQKLLLAKYVFFIVLFITVPSTYVDTQLAISTYVKIPNFAAYFSTKAGQHLYSELIYFTPITVLKTSLSR